VKQQAQKIDFSDILSPAQIVDEPRELEFYGRDVCPDYKPSPSLILLPKTVEEVQALLRRCNERKISLVPSGGRTGYSAGATATLGEVILSLSKLNKILEINSLDLTVRCEAGVTTQTLKDKVLEKGLFYPMDFASKGSSQIGGNIATNAGGIRVIRYGSTRDWVLGLKAVCADGTMLDLNGALYKNASGYDLKSLLIGSEGTLAVVVEATLRLTTPPLPASVALAASKNLEAALQTLSELRSAGFLVNVFEYFENDALELVSKHHSLTRPWSEKHQNILLIEVQSAGKDETEAFHEKLGKLLEDGILAQVVLAQNSKQEKELFSLREFLPETLNSHYLPYKNDLSVPIPHIPAYVKELKLLVNKLYSDLGAIIFGHLGDGNLHLNILRPKELSDTEFLKRCKQGDQEVFALTKRFQGSISAEHGVGLLKKKYLHFSRDNREIELMRSIKRSFDPNNILNPGKIFDMLA